MEQFFLVENHRVMFAKMLVATVELQVQARRHLSRIGGFVKENIELWDVGWNFWVSVSRGSIYLSASAAPF